MAVSAVAFLVANMGNACYHGCMNRSFDTAVEVITARHPEYAAAAYNIVRLALDAVSVRFCSTREKPHLTAEELYLGTCACALDKYGPLARLLLSDWGVREAKDVGRMVYNLIEVGVFGKQESDSLEDFSNLPPLGELLDAPYLFDPLHPSESET